MIQLLWKIFPVKAKLEFKFMAYIQFFSLSAELVKRENWVKGCTSPLQVRSNVHFML